MVYLEHKDAILENYVNDTLKDDRKCPIINLFNPTQKRIEMCYITSQSHHWKLNQWDGRIQCPSTNQIPHSKNEQPITAIVITYFSYITLYQKK
jgi:hypothetical protein